MGARGLASKAPGSANLDWGNLGFQARPVNNYVRYNWKEGSWGEGSLIPDGMVTVHALSNALNYGQAVFEGLKAYHCADGTVCAFNPQANHARISGGCERLFMPEVSKDLFISGIEKVIRENAEFIPPHGTGGALYIRPLLFGHGAQLGLGPAPEYQLVFACNPVGAYYKGGLEGVDALVVENFDRAAPKGVGNVKVAGNYAPDVLPSKEAKGKGFSVCLYLDAATHSYVEVRLPWALLRAATPSSTQQRASIPLDLPALATSPASPLVPATSTRLRSSPRQTSLVSPRTTRWSPPCPPPSSSPLPRVSCSRLQRTWA